jgi:hypothetical protein
MSDQLGQPDVPASSTPIAQLAVEDPIVDIIPIVDIPPVSAANTSGEEATSALPSFVPETELESKPVEREPVKAPVKFGLKMIQKKK